MTKIFLDTNVILDLYVAGREGKEAARTLLDLKESAYVLRKHFGKDRLKELIRELLHFCDALPMSDLSIRDAMESSCPDFEDALQISCAETKECDFLLTSSLRHFQGNTWMTVLTPAQFLEKLQERNATAGLI